MYIYILTQKRSNNNLLPFDRDFTFLSFFWVCHIYIYAYILVSLDLQSHLISLFGRSGASCHLLIHFFLTYSIDTGNYQTLITKQYTLVTKIIQYMFTDIIYERAVWDHYPLSRPLLFGKSEIAQRCSINSALPSLSP